ncbi:MAG: rod shape-determining protein MreD [Candidatus Omnitrophica bacterium]|nr:rod shape-determining protein MreD [Candidatus Omnitrophota bacterium]
MYRIGRPRIYTALIITLILESTLFNFFKIGGIQPNFMLILVVFVGLYSEWGEALETGIAAGLLRGAFSAGSVGINLVAFGACALLVSYFKNKVYRENFLTQIIVTLTTALFISVFAILARIVMKDVLFVGIDLFGALTRTVLLISLYTSLFSPPIFYCLRALLPQRS